jgi:hypothetical protein
MATNSLIEGELFHKITRDERQEECRKKWIQNKCVGTVVASTGFGIHNKKFIIIRLVYI